MCQDGGWGWAVTRGDKMTGLNVGMVAEGGSGS